MNEIKRDEIVNYLKRCAEDKPCQECLYHTDLYPDCVVRLMKDAALVIDDVITGIDEKDDEIEDLKAELRDKDYEIERLEEELEDKN